MGATLVKHLAGVQTDRAPSETGKLVLDLVILNLAVLRYDFLQQDAKLWDVPLSIT